MLKFEITKITRKIQNFLSFLILEWSIKTINNLQNTAWKTEQKDSDKIEIFNINQNLLCRFS